MAMPLFGLVTAFAIVVFADLQGSRRTRGFTRLAFVGVLLSEWGFSIDGLSTAVTNAMGAIPV